MINYTIITLILLPQMIGHLWEARMSQVMLNTTQEAPKICPMPLDMTTPLQKDFREVEAMFGITMGFNSNY